MKSVRQQSLYFAKQTYSMDQLMDEVFSHEDQSCSCQDQSLRDLPFSLFNLPRWMLLLLIKLYQATVSRALPSNTCRFYPSCSHYGYQAVYKYGVLKGGWLAVRRILRCNPFNPGGIDPVP